MLHTGSGSRIWRRWAGVLLATVALAGCGSTPDPPPYDPPVRERAPDVQPPEPTVDAEPWTRGDDPYLADLWDGCATGNADACAALYDESPVGSEYEVFGATCGGLTTGGGCQAEPEPEVSDFAEYAQITTWYSAAEADNSAWVHFKAVDAGTYTVQEVLGSDLVDLVDEADALAQTPERVALVNALRQMMLDAGWTELGVGGTEWYQFVYGR